MSKPTRRFWVLLSILAVLVLTAGIQRGVRTYRAISEVVVAREVKVKQEVAWIIEGCATSTRRDLNLNKYSERAIQEGVGQLSSYVTVFLNHNHTLPVGRIVAVNRANNRILIKMEVSKTQPRIWQLVREGVICSFSIGSIVYEEGFDFDNEIQEPITIIERAQIVEVSLVFIPANPDARITAWYVEPR